MTTTLHCPSCGLRACDVAEDYDPFAADPIWGTRPIAVSLACTNGHAWIAAAPPMTRETPETPFPGTDDDQARGG